MAKLHNKTVQAALQKVIETGRVGEDEGKQLIASGFITLNQPLDVDGNNMAAVTLTDKGKAGMPVANTGAAPVASNQYPIMKGIVIPPSKRGAGRVAGPPKYQFDTMEVGDTFFVGATDNMPDPLKSMNSAVSNANNKYRVDTGKTEVVKRAKRDGKKALIGADGKKIIEEVTVPIYEYPRKFVVRAIKGGVKLGEWTAPIDGVLVGREK